MSMKKKTTINKTVKKPENQREQQNVTIGKKDFLKKISDKAYELSGTGVTQKELHYIFDAMCAVIEDEVRLGHSIRIIGFGTFQQKITPARTGHNPQTGKKIQIPETKRLTFHSTVKY